MSMDPDELRERLGRMSPAYKDAVAPGELPPDGLYQCLVERFDFFEHDGRAFLKTELRVEFPEGYRHLPIELVHPLEDPDRLGATKKHLNTLGIELTDYSQLIDALHTVKDVPVEVAVKTGTRINEKTGMPYRNAYVNKRLGHAITSTDVPVQAPTPVGQTQDGNTDPIPF